MNFRFGRNFKELVSCLQVEKQIRRVNCLSWSVSQVSCARVRCCIVLAHRIGQGLGQCKELLEAESLEVWTVSVLESG